MRLDEKGLQLSATDVAAHLSCRYLTTLDLAVARHERAKPRPVDDPHIEVLRERGDEHERAYLDNLSAAGLTIESIPRELPIEAAAALTLEAMRRGVDVIVQSALVHGSWSGRADVLRRVEVPSPVLGGWSYEPHDTKLARETKAETLLQLCVYAELLEALQGSEPEWVWVVTPESGFEAPERYRVEEHAAYYRVVRGSLVASVGLERTAVTYPLPCAHCDVCRWAVECDERRRADDHLCLVTGMRRSAERELETVGVGTLAGLAAWIPAAEWRPGHGSRESYEKLQDQARLQFVSRGQTPPVHKLVLPVTDADGKPLGLARLPEPSPGDLFLDLEGDSFYGDGGLEYLFGLAAAGSDGAREYRRWWATDRAGEKRAFEALMDAVMEAWDRDPSLHIFHFGHYEPSALKRLASCHGARENDIDRLLRSQRFVDLLQVVRQGVRAGVESYSIKALEPLYDFPREANLRQAGRVRAEVEVAIERGLGVALTPEARELVERYNRDDCWSTRALRHWLEARRAELVANGTAVLRPSPGGDGEASEELGEHLEQVHAVAARLLAGLPEDPALRSEEQHALWLLAHSLEFHRREQKVHWWEFHRLADLDEVERLEEPCAIAGLRHVRRTGPQSRRATRPLDRYEFPPQDVDRRTHGVYLDHDPKHRLGEVVDVEPAEGWVEVLVDTAAIGERPCSVFLFDDIRPKPKDAALLALGEWVAEHGIDAGTGIAPGLARAGRDLLLRQPPRGCGLSHGSLRRPGEEVVDAARRLALELKGGVLPIQGPPGSGKTYTGARMIVELVRWGKKVGITATSHKVIRKLLDEVIEAAAEEQFNVRCLQRVKEIAEGALTMPPRQRRGGAGGACCGPLPAGITECDENKDVDRVLAADGVDVVAGTAWLWARDQLRDSMDTIFVDEAGQMSLADVLAVSPAARNLVLLGDPQQLEQPIQGAHPEGCDVAALKHLVSGGAGASTRATIPPDRGLFIEHTRRMHPDVCRFTSELFYEGKLRSLPGLERQELLAPPPFDRSGLYYLEIEHEGCSNSSPEEAEAIAELIGGWLSAGAEWVDREGVHRLLTLQDVLVVAPYNAQVALLREVMGRSVPGAHPTKLRLGTVDKFQGQEAPVVVYSMTTSSPEEAPRGMEFLYNLNRLNVATSRARCGCVLVASPRLLAPECKTPRQMRLANALCAYVERATVVRPVEPGQSGAHLVNAAQMPD